MGQANTLRASQHAGQGQCLAGVAMQNASHSPVLQEGVVCIPGTAAGVNTCLPTSSEMCDSCVVGVLTLNRALKYWPGVFRS